MALSRKQRDSDSFVLLFDGELVDVRKLLLEEFCEHHRNVLLGMKVCGEGLHFPNTDWRVRFLGMGEEKAVYCVCDSDNRVFALEVLRVAGYRNGRLADTEYYEQQMYIPQLRELERGTDSIFQDGFSGNLKVREFVHGYEWAKFHLRVDKPTFGVDTFLTTVLQAIWSNRFQQFATTFGDVHDANVMFELRNWRMTGFPIPAFDAAGKFHIFRVGLRPIDVR